MKNHVTIPKLRLAAYHPSISQSKTCAMETTHFRPNKFDTESA